jgi:patatin-related protein
MESAPPLPPPSFSREVRLGLVAYSGVSLAMYTSGVCQEFYQAVRGRGIYKLLKALIDADIVVDTLSGTSIGGVNVALLSYALTNSTTSEAVDFKIFSEVWQNSADIQQLLQQPSLATGVLLDDDGYQQQQLEAALINAFQCRIISADRDWVSPFPELDLLLTSTDFWGKTYRLVDDSGAVVEVQDHHSLFHLKHRQGRKEPFNPLSFNLVGAKPQHTFQALAKLCRLTSALPMVFSAVQVDLNNSENLIDRQLGIWGNLHQRHWQHRPEGRQINFLDGSLLHNSPFTTVIHTMSRRPADRWTQRVVFYIAPTTSSKGRASSAPANFTPLLLDLPLAQGVANDLRQVQEHNQKVQRYQELLATAENSLNALPPDSALQLQQKIYLRTRLINLRTQVIPHLTRLAAGGDNDRLSELERLAKLLTHHQVGQIEQDQREECLQDFAPQMVQLDVEYSLRQHSYLSHKIHDHLITTKSPNERFYLEVLSKRIGQSIQLLEVIQTSLRQLLSNLVISDNFYAMLGVKKSDHFLRPLIYEYVFRLHRYLLDVQALPLLLPTVDGLPAEMDGMVALSELFLNLPLTANETQSDWLPSEQISMVWQQLQQKIEILANAAHHGQYLWNKHRFHYDRRENKRFLSMLTQIESATTMLLHNSPTIAARSLLQQFQGFENLDRVLYPYEYLTDLEQKEPLSTVRISPTTAQLGWSQGHSAREKLAGHDFYAAGGLFNKSWQANDLLWGRLDGLNRLIEGLVTSVTIKCFSGLVQRESIRLELAPTDYLEFLVSESLPDITGHDRLQIKAHLAYLSQPDLDITAAELQYRLNDIVMAGHRQILAADLDQVFQIVAAPQKIWQGMTSQALTPDPLKSSMMKMAQEITKESLASLAIEQQQFFRTQYKVGSENLFENVPGMVWINWASRWLLVLRDLLLNSFKPRRVKRLRQNSLYLAVDRLLDSCYWWLQSQGTKLILQIPLQSVRWAVLGILAVVSMLSVLLTTFNPMIWLVVGVVSLVSWGVIDLQFWQRRQPPHKSRKFLTVKSSVDR